MIRYAEEFNQIESANILKQFIQELERRNISNLRAKDPNYHTNEDDLSLPPLGPAFTQNDQGIYDDPEAIQYAIPMVHERQENSNSNGNNNYAVRNNYHVYDAVRKCMVWLPILISHIVFIRHQFLHYLE